MNAVSNPVTEHVITIEQQEHIEGRGTVPFVFRPKCSCGILQAGYNAPKWVFVAIQIHWEEAGLTNGRGLLVPGKLD